MYSSFYKLKSKPFQLNPDPKFFFNSDVHRRALAYLQYGLEQGEGFIVVTGAPGTGKTTLVKALFNRLDSQKVIAGQLVSTQVGADDTLRLISAAFGLAYENVAKAKLLNNLESFFRLQAQKGRRVLLVVDEAQNLPIQSIEELRMLSNFECAGRAIFQSFLLGQDEFRQTLSAPGMEQVRQRVKATLHLKPFNLRETTAYILHRLATAGWNKDPEFTEEAFKEIFKFSQGTPRIINTLCDRLMLFGFLEELHEIDEKAAKAVIEEIKDDSVLPEEVNVENNSVKGQGSAIKQALSHHQQKQSDLSLENRVIQLESTVEILQKTLKKERALLRKVILLHLELGEGSEEDLIG